MSTQNLNVCQTAITKTTAKASASSRCPTCNEGVLLAGTGRQGETVALTGSCKRHGETWIYHTIR